MKRISLALIAMAAVLSSCTDGSYEKAEGGLEYRIIKDGKGDAVKYGQFISFHAITRLQGGSKDTLLRDSREQGGMQFLQFDSLSLPQPYFGIFGKMRAGDSLVVRMKTDSVFKADPASMPPFIKKGMWMVTSFKLVSIYKTQTEADKARQANMMQEQVAAKERANAQLKKDEGILLDYFKKNNITPIKREDGTYVQIIQQGTGPVADTSNFAKINYTGRTLAGKMFDSNTDPAKGHVTPLITNLTNDPTLGNAVIGGMSSGIRGLQQGAKAKIFIPSTLGYGPMGNGGDIAPNDILVFDVEILELMSKASVAAENAREQAKMAAEQKRYTDSLQRAQRDTANK